MKEKVAITLAYIAAFPVLAIVVVIAVIACIIAAVFYPDAFRDYEEDL